MAVSEARALSIIFEELNKLQTKLHRRAAVVSIGDDCAVLPASSGQAVWTVDSCQEDVHFKWEWMRPEDAAHKSFHAAISDVCAMGVTPTSALVHLTLSPRITASYLRRFAQRQAELCHETGVVIVGGNVSSGPAFAVMTTVLGHSKGAVVLRKGARPGDELWLIGELGLARAGLLLLQAGQGRARGAAERDCVSFFRRPLAQVKRGPQLAGRASACLDVSDGLTRDAQNLARASSVQLVIDAKLLRARLQPSLVEVCHKQGWDALELAVTGGEDYALLATGARNCRPAWARPIGRVEQGSGVYLRSAGTTVELRGGFEH